MKTLYLTRHAKAGSDEPTLTDFDKPLTEQGLHDVPKVAKQLQCKSAQPQQIISSTALRAQTTAKLLAQDLAIAPSELIYKDKMYNASLETLLQITHDLADETSAAMLVGHNPAMSQLAEYLTGNPIAMSTCSVYAVTFEVESWQEITQHSGREKFHLSKDY